MSNKRIVKIGPVTIGGEDKLPLIQTMWDKKLEYPFSRIYNDLKYYKTLGCQLIRFAVPDMETAELIGEGAVESPIPLVADIHFDYKIALRCMDFPFSKIRINPGNIGNESRVREVVSKAIDTQTALRIGANSGSLPSKLVKRKDKAQAMVEAVEEQLDLLEQMDFKDIVVSLKSSDININYEANTLFASRHDYPLHLGITEAGPLIPSLVKSTWGLGKLLSEGIGDTLRISISDSPEKELLAARELLSVIFPEKTDFVNIVSCPKCGRFSFDSHRFVESVKDELYSLNKKVTIAIMGCLVNGPGEAREADLGVTGSGEKLVIFKKGKIIRRETACTIHQAFLEELKKL